MPGLHRHIPKKLEEDASDSCFNLLEVSSSEKLLSVLAILVQPLHDKIASLELQIGDLREKNLELITLITREPKIIKNTEEAGVINVELIEPSCASSYEGKPADDSVLHQDGTLSVAEPKICKTSSEAPGIEREILVGGDHSSIADQHSGPVIGEAWKTVTRRKSPALHRQGGHRKGLIAGVKKGTNLLLKTAPRKAYLYVSQLDPSTKPEDVMDFLSGEFPEVTCEVLQSRHPELYASFKVSLDRDNLEKAMNAETWPCGSIIRRFFIRRRETDQKR